MKRRTRSVTRSLVADLHRSVAGCAGGVGVVPAVIIACVLAVVLLGGLAAAGVARDGSGGVRIPFVDRGGSEADDDTSRANDEPDENESAEHARAGENEPAESEREREPDENERGEG